MGISCLKVSRLTDCSSWLELNPVLGVGTGEQIVPNSDCVVPALDQPTFQMTDGTTIIVVPSHLVEFTTDGVVIKNRVARRWVRAIERCGFTCSVCGDADGREETVCIWMQFFKD